MQRAEDNPSPTQPTPHSPSALTLTMPVQKQTFPPHQSTSASSHIRGHTNIELSSNTFMLIPKSSIRLLIPESMSSPLDFDPNLTGSSPVKISAIGTSDVNTIFAYFLVHSLELGEPLIHKQRQEKQ